MGPETWGAIYDLYMSELMDLLELQNYADLQQMQAALKSPSGMTDFVGCGEHMPFNPARRNPFEQGDDEYLEGSRRIRPIGGSRSCSSIPARRSTSFATRSPGSANPISVRFT